MTTPVLTEIFEQLEQLRDDMRYQVLTLVRALKSLAEHGVAVKKLVEFSGSIPAQEVDDIRQAIELGCEQVDLDEW